MSAIADLYRQLSYAPPETRRREMEAAEKLIADVDPQTIYPLDFIVYRITGYRPDYPGEPQMLVGEALIADLVSMIQLLSHALHLPRAWNDRSPLQLDVAAKRLRVSLKTLQRYRKLGLVCHYVYSDEGALQLICFEDALDHFRNTHLVRLQRPAAFTRINGQHETAIIDKARHMRAQEGLSLNEAARRIAKDVGRAHETIRMLLRRHDRRAAQPIFTERGPLSSQEIRTIHRAWMRGIEPSALAQRFNRSKPSIHRAINMRRTQLLRSLQLNCVLLPTFELPDSDSIILGASAAMTELDAGVPRDWPGLIALALGGAEVAPNQKSQVENEDALIAAFNLLKMRAALSIARLDDSPRSDVLDRIETDLRWAGMLQRRLVMLGLPAALRRVEQNVGRPLRALRRDELNLLLAKTVEVLQLTIEALDPGRGQRLERIVSQSMDRALARMTLPRLSTRAAPKTTTLTPNWQRCLANLNQWESFLNQFQWLRMLAPQLPSPYGEAITHRYGWFKTPPLTVAEVAKTLNIASTRAAQIVHQAHAMLRALAREQ